MKCRYFCRLPLDISPVYLTRGISKLYRQSREKIYIKGIGQRHMPDFLGGHPDNLTEFISYRITGVP